MGDIPEPLKKLLPDRGRAIEEHRAAYEAMRKSPVYAGEVTRLQQTIADFSKVLWASWFTFLRAPDEFRQNSLMLQSLTDMEESALALQIAIENTARNAARRDLRYLLELAVKARFVDLSMPKASLEERLAFFDRKVRSYGITPEVRHLKLRLAGEQWESEVVADLLRAYARACQYVHPTVAQIRERLDLAAKGVTTGFDSAEELTKINDEVFEVLALVLVLLFHSLGFSLCGEFLQDIFSKRPDWCFHRHRHIVVLDQLYDYKAERKGRLDQLRQLRTSYLESSR